MTITAAPPVRRTKPTWVEVEPGFHVASVAGDYFGCVDAVTGGFVARDATGTPVGLFDTLSAAQASLLTVVRDPHAPTHLDRRAKAGMHLATAAALTAIAFALTAGALAPIL